jgi:hypothetical protein
VPTNQVDDLNLPDAGVDNGNANVGVENGKENVVGENSRNARDTIDPGEMYSKAASALERAKELKTMAEAYSDAPDRLSNEFIATAFPFDRRDNSYAYCIICGLPGDLLRKFQYHVHFTYHQYLSFFAILTCSLSTYSECNTKSVTKMVAQMSCITNAEAYQKFLRLTGFVGNVFPFLPLEMPLLRENTLRQRRASWLVLMLQLARTRPKVHH